MIILALSDVLLVSVFGVVTVLVGIFGSVVVGNSAARSIRLAKEADWERQDVVAERAEASARAIVEVNERAVKIGEQNASQLQQVHTLVNSQMTSAKRSERDQVEVTLALLHEMAELRRTNGQEPSTKALAAIAATEAKLTRLNVEVADRERQDETARAQAMASTEAGKAAQTQLDAADQQHAAAELQAQAAEKQIAVAEGQAAVAVEQANVADRQAAAYYPPTTPPAADTTE